MSAYRTYALLPATHLDAFIAYATKYQWLRVAVAGATEVARLQHPHFAAPCVVERSTEHKKHYIVHGSGLKTLRGYKTTHGVA